MTTHPEDAMTREQALEEAFEAACKAACPSCAAGYPIDDGNDGAQHLRNGRYHPNRNYSNTGFGGGYHVCKVADARLAWKAALASAQQESAPSADAEEIAREIADAVRNEAIDGPDWDFDDKVAAKVVLAMLKKHAAALRRYADDGGVTDEQVEAAARILATQRGHKNLAEPIKCTGNTTQAVWQFYCDDARQILEAAARAKPS